MEWLWGIVLGFVIVGVVMAVRERRTGRGKIIDERATERPQTEADREAIRAEGSTTHHGIHPHDHQ
ncbi:MAG: hypothetical protein AAFO97_06965 [Pseudomonadota bacterium]